jgi:uncharacterized glyoxalase superfamily protein PhnB
MLSNRSFPRSIVIPEIPYDDVPAATRWLCDAFGFTVRIAMGAHRAQLNVGDGAIVLTEQPADDVRPAVCSTMIRVENIDAHYERARKFGARILRDPRDYPYGERQYNAEDFAGHRWHFTQSIADVDPRDWGGTPGQL